MLFTWSETIPGGRTRRHKKEIYEETRTAVKFPNVF
jgi:hypothetical protein